MKNQKLKDCTWWIFYLKIKLRFWTALSGRFSCFAKVTWNSLKRFKLKDFKAQVLKGHLSY